MNYHSKKGVFQVWVVNSVEKFKLQRENHSIW
jgi:hypothetical protein